MTVCRLCRVTGRVQGVFFRASTQEQALKCNLTGYAKNLMNGDVEVLVCGAPGDVEVLCEWLWQGPTHARVEKVSCEEVPQNPPANFTTG